MLRVAIIFLFLLFLPSELSVYVGSIRLELNRILLLIFSYYIARRSLSFNLLKFEYLIFLYVALASYSFLYNDRWAGIESAGVVILEVLFSYLLGRGVIAEYGLSGLKTVLRFVAVIFLLLAPFSIYESYSGFKIFHAISSSILGVTSDVYITEQYFRNGVYRVYSVFSHPILYSIVAMGLIGSTYYAFKDRKVYIIGFLVALFTSMSSVGFIMLIIQVTGMFFERLVRAAPALKTFFLWTILMSIFAIELASNRGFLVWMAMKSALNPWNAYVRILQWEHAWDDVMHNFWLGIGHGDWSRPYWLPASIDAYWLVTPLTNGVPAFLALSIFWFSVMRLLYQSYLIRHERIYFVLLISIISIAFAGVTVHFFDKAPMFIYFFIGASVGTVIHYKSAQKGMVNKK